MKRVDIGNLGCVVMRMMLRKCLSRRDPTYAFAERFCVERNYSRASMEPKPDEKLDGFFEMLSDMGLSDVEDLQDEPYSIRVIVKAMRKMKMFKTRFLVSAWRAKDLVVSTIPSGFNFANFFSIPLDEGEE